MTVTGSWIFDIPQCLLISVCICKYTYTCFFFLSLSLSLYYIYVCVCVHIYIYISYIHLRGCCHIMNWMQVANFLAKVRYIKVVHTLDTVRYQLTWFWMILGGVTISRLSKAVFDIAKFEFPRPYFTRNLLLYLFDGCCKHIGIHIVVFSWDPRADCSDESWSLAEIAIKPAYVSHIHGVRRNTNDRAFGRY